MIATSALVAFGLLGPLAAGAQASGLSAPINPSLFDSTANLSRCGGGSGSYWNWYYCNDPEVVGCSAFANGTCAEYGVDVTLPAGTPIYAPESGTVETDGPCAPPNWSCWVPGRVRLYPDGGQRYPGLFGFGHVNFRVSAGEHVNAGQEIAVVANQADYGTGWNNHTEFMYSPSGGNTQAAFTGGCDAPRDPCGEAPSNPNSPWTVLVALETGTVTQPVTDNGGSNITGVPSHRCLDVIGGSIENGTRVQLYDCLGDPQQHWVWTSAGQLTVYGSPTKCLDANDNQSGANGTIIQVWNCTGASNQRWIAEPNGTIVSAAYGKCLDAINGGTADGTLLQLWSCDGLSQQQWTGQPEPNGGGPIEGLGSHRCLDDTGAGISPGTRVQIWDCSGVAQQQWILQGTELRVFADKCLDAVGGATGNGTPIQIWYCNGDPQQQWQWNASGEIVGLQSHRCLDAVNFGTANGTSLQLWQCNATTNQLWSRDIGTPPKVTLTSHPAPTTASRSASFTFTATGGGSAVTGFSCSLDGATGATCSSPASYSNLSAGMHTFMVSAHDAAGGMSQAVSFTWDITASVTTPQPTPGSSSCVVPRLHGLSLKKAKRQLVAAHCKLGRVKRPRHVRRHHRLKVVRQSAKPGSREPLGYRVGIRLR